MGETNIDNIKWLSKESENLSDEELIDFLTTCCSSEQTGMILDHIRLLEYNMMIGYDNKDVFVMIVNEDDENDEILKITKSKL